MKKLIKYGPKTAFGPSIFPNQLFTMFSATQEGGTPLNEKIGDMKAPLVLRGELYLP
jgi:hypothetical protein